MKNILYLLIFTACLYSCTGDEENNDSNGYPDFVDMAFMLEEENVDMQIAYATMVDGQLAPQGSEYFWIEMGKIERLSNLSGKNIYGPRCGGTCEEEYSQHLIWSAANEDNAVPEVHEHYSLIKNANNTIDTLKVTTNITLDPYVLKHLVYLNGESKQIFDENGQANDETKYNFFINLRE